MDVALYFPYISVPPGSWFTRVLLYCETLLAYSVRR